MVGFGRRIREARGDATSQSALGKLVGKSQSTIDNWEHEKHGAEPARLRAPRESARPIADLAGVRGMMGMSQPERMDRETVRLIVLALERRILRHRLLRPDPDGRARMILAIYDLVSQRDANDARPLTQLIEDLLDVHTGRR
jgi:transcriptional regulator with XRE-family HTH domain